MQFMHRAVTHRLRSPFRVAHGVSATRTTVFARLDTPDGPAWGEGALVPYYPYTLNDLTAYLDGIGETFGPKPGAPFDLDAALAAIPDGPAPARCALDLALHDAWGKAAEQPLWSLWGLDPKALPPSSFTLSIPDDLDAYRAELDAVAHLPVLKLKVGTGDADRDLELVRLARGRTGAALGVDANSAWTVDEAVRIVPELAALGGILYVEQPLAWRTPDGLRTSHEAWHRLRERLPDGLPPLLADEAVQGLDDVDGLAGAADGVNVKLTKTGGLAGARRMIDRARAHGMQVLVGCMVETAVGVTAAAHLAPLADFADLDGAVLLDHPAVSGGMVWHDGRMTLPHHPGLGVFTWDSGVWPS